MEYLIPPAPDLPYPLGRAGVHHDPANKLFRALVEPPPRRETPNILWYTRDVFDQGATSSCTAQAAVGVLRTAPFRRQFDRWPDFDSPDERMALYRSAQHEDPWDGVDYEGSSTDAPFKVLRNMGAITGWRWLFGESELWEWVTWFGPVSVGTVWTRSMFAPNDRGFIHPDADVVGGHAYRLVHASARRQAYRMVNSWGRDWGQDGRAWITRAEMTDLLGQDGEVVTVAGPQ